MAQNTISPARAGRVGSRGATCIHCRI